MASSCFFALLSLIIPLVASVSVVLPTVEEVDSHVTGKWKLGMCMLGDTSFSHSSAEPVFEITYSEDGNSHVFKWSREEDGGKVSGNIYRKDDQWSSDCSIDREANSETERELQNKIASFCNKITGMYYVNGKMNLMQFYSTAFCVYNRVPIRQHSGRLRFG